MSFIRPAEGKNPKTRAEFVKPYDYIAEPKADGFMHRETEAATGVQSVLVSVDSMDKLREAYSSYFADTTVFLEVLEEVMGKK